MPFRELTSANARGLLSVCELHSAMQLQQDERGRAAYVCAAGESSFYRRKPHQLSSTLAFMLGRDELRAYRVRAAEIEPLRECLVWLREQNPHFKSHWSKLERVGPLWAEVQAQIPQGRSNVPVRIRRNRAMDAAASVTIGETLGSEDAVLVLVDPEDLPRSWATLDALAEPIGEAVPRASGEVADAGAARGAGQGGPMDIEMRPEWFRDITAAVRDSEQSSTVTLGDNHLDAKLFPDLHPYGTGSLHGEEGSGGMQRYAKSRLLSLQHHFRRSPVWSFWMLERIIKNDLYFRERKRKGRAMHEATAAQRASAQEGALTAKSAPAPEAVPTSTSASAGVQAETLRGQKRSAEAAGLPSGPTPQDAAGTVRDNYAVLFGRVEPRHIPESSAWWKARQTELMSISDEHELGLMTGMVTSTQNDASAELLAHARRGPCAKATQEELYEYSPIPLVGCHAFREGPLNIYSVPASASQRMLSKASWLCIRSCFFRRVRRFSFGRWQAVAC